ncbi:MAG: T9SS type A sorting domain-containing protein [Candidatus Marinimicrobia bacterium]|nr:T9SS type A sorting domain-containing protein [Candidatus Neomarinimicrobiota bacterium]
MKKFVLGLTLLLLAALAFGQHELIVPSATSFDDLLNATIAGDTTAAGERNDSLRVYVLERNGVYFANSSIRNDTWPLIIIAQEGEGNLPMIFQTPTAEATNGFDLFRIKGNCHLENLVYVGFVESDTAAIAKIGNSLVRSDAAGFDIVIKNCIVSQTQGQFIRTQHATRKVELRNNIFANMGDLGRSNFGAGKGIDFRDTSCDSAILVNNTWVNFQDRIIRHRSSTAAINNFIFDHNTVINGMSYHGTLALGYVGDYVQITNNFWYDTFLAGQDTDAVRQSEFNECEEQDDFGFSKMTWISSVPNDTTAWNVKSNYYSVSAAVQNFYNTVMTADHAFKGEGIPLTSHIEGKSGVEAFVKEAIDVVDRPEPMIAMATWYRKPIADGGAGKTKATDNFNRTTDDYDRATYEYLLNTLNLSYPTTTAAYTGGTDGKPVGDLNWFGMDVAIDHSDEILPTGFSLEQNYPNPFNPTTKIGFTLEKAGEISLTVYNLLGQAVALPVAENLKAGRHEISFDASHLANGVYFYQLRSGKQAITRKMLLMK